MVNRSWDSATVVIEKKIRRVKESLVVLEEEFPQQQERRKKVPRVDDACVNVKREIRESDDDYYYDSAGP